MWPFRRRKTTKQQTVPDQWAEADSVLRMHFKLQEEIQKGYREREKKGLRPAINACEMQIALSPKAAVSWMHKYPPQPDEPRLPRHVGFEQLAIIREKEGNYSEVIRLCREAKKQGWNGEWDKRIARSEAKIAKAT